MEPGVVGVVRLLGRRLGRPTPRVRARGAGRGEGVCFGCFPFDDFFGFRGCWMIECINAALPRPDRGEVCRYSSRYRNEKRMVVMIVVYVLPR